MKKRVCFLLCIVMLGIMLVLPVSAATFRVSYYNEAIYAGGSTTCTAQAECKVCGNAYGEVSDHRWSPTFLYQDSTGHAWICADCKNHSEVEPHTPYAAAAAPEATTVSQTTVFQPEDTPKAKQQVPVNALAVVLLGVVSFSIAITTTVIIMKKKK